MTDNRDQSQLPDWLNGDEVVAADSLGPFELGATADFTIGGDGYADINGKVRVRVKDTNTDTFILDEEFDPLWGEFSTVDHDRWKLAAEAAIAEAGYDLDALLAELRENAA